MRRLFALWLLLLPAPGRGAAARFHRPRRQAGTGGRQCQHDADGARACPGCRASPKTTRFYEFFRRFMPPNAPPREYQTRSLGSGFHHQQRRLHPDQRPCRRQGRRDHGQAQRQARVQGQGHRRRQAHRRGGHQDRGNRSAQGQRWAIRNKLARRRMGGGDRFAVRLREHRHGGHRERQGPLAAAGELRPLHPDRCRHQSRQLRRTAVQPEGRSGRHQFPDLQPHRRLHGLVLRHPDRRGDGHCQPAQDRRQGHARPHRRRDPGSHQGAGGIVRLAQSLRARWSTRWRRAVRPTRPASRRPM